MAYSSSPFSPLLVGGVSSMKLRYFSPETDKGQFFGGASLDSWRKSLPSPIPSTTPFVLIQCLPSGQ